MPPREGGISPPPPGEARAEAIGPDHPLAAAAGADIFLGFEERCEEGLRAVVAGSDATLGPRAAQ